ncbi:unnamed protein product [Pneumocystis jirovecii]|uniref:N-acetyltransferase domain-containing protein n=1 Tax=Pneumocystis jirovecii TaxID=42068 RepID=L0PEW9_PNEJI|nr:unnamed protein product [Pneumocystis jirovecii]
MEEPDSGEPHGHITSLSVLRTYRRLGLAAALMHQSQKAMAENFGATYVSLHVRKTNRAALQLYRDHLHFVYVCILHFWSVLIDRITGVEKAYYADGEDAFSMRCNIHHLMDDHVIDHVSSEESSESETETKGAACTEAVESKDETDGLESLEKLHL